MNRERKTAVLNITLSGVNDSEIRALDNQREYQFALTIGDTAFEGGLFYSPLGDERWNDLARAIRELPVTENKRRLYDKVYNAGVLLYDVVTDKSRALRTFLSEESGPRRLVIRSNRPEIHLLPWEAMVNEDTELLAHNDISVVRSTENFNEQPWIFGSSSNEERHPLKIQGIFGPGVQQLSFQALKELQELAAKQVDQGLKIEAKQESLSGDWFERLDAEIIHIEAHGDLSGNIQMPDWLRANDPIELAEKLRASEIVLLWSCYSAMIHSWGKSLGMRLHQRGAKFVLSFSTPLRYETSAAIANHFYTYVLSARDPLDPETAIVAERKRLFEHDLMTCDWAAMTLWLRQPVDLSAAVVNGPRVPEDAWAVLEEATSLQNKLKDKVGPGRAVLLTKRRLPDRLPYSLSAPYRGAVVYLKGIEGLKNDSIFERLEIKPAELKSHPADRFLLLLKILSRYPRSLLIWSDVRKPELRLVDLLSTEIPKTLDVVLVSAEDIEPSPNIVLINSEIGVVHEESLATNPTPLSEIERLWQLAETEQFPESVKLWDKLNADYADWDHATKLRYQFNGYWSLIRIRPEHAEACIKEIERLDAVEGFLLGGNYQSRNSLLAEAQLSYERAAEVASLPRDKARAWLELAYLFSEQGNPIAEDYYRRALELLENAENISRDWRWSSALGRALRDLADYLIDKSKHDEAEPGKECDDYLNRALAIHALDDRLNQVGAVLRTQGKLARNRKQWLRRSSSAIRRFNLHFYRKQSRLV